jgi:hypothetical protein
MGEEPRKVTQEGALAFDASELLKLGGSHNLRVRELLQSLVAPPVRADALVDVVHQTEQDGDSLF